MKINQRKTIFDSLKKYCITAKENEYIEVTEWTNGEGVDVSFSNRLYSLSYDEIDAINYLIKTLQLDDE